MPPGSIPIIPWTKEDWVKLFKKTFRFTGGEIVGEFLMSLGYLPGAHAPGCPVGQEDRPAGAALGQGGKAGQGKKARPALSAPWGRHNSERGSARTRMDRARTLA